MARPKPDRLRRGQWLVVRDTTSIYHKLPGRYWGPAKDRHGRPRILVVVQSLGGPVLCPMRRETVAKRPRKRKGGDRARRA